MPIRWLVLLKVHQTVGKRSCTSASLSLLHKLHQELEQQISVDIADTKTRTFDINYRQLYSSKSPNSALIKPYA